MAFFTRTGSPGEEASWLQRLRRALEADLFVLHFQPIVALSDGRRATFSTTVLRTPPVAVPSPYTFEQIEGGLHHGLTNARLIALVKQNGVDFALTPELERRLRKAGANDTLLAAIAGAEP